MSDGKSLEAFVKFVEELLLQRGFKVTSRECVYDDNGTQIAEFDLVVRGKVGSTDFSWLIECRDRPSGGPQNRSWINELVGRRDDFKFDKVTAVSTSGFSKGAVERANDAGIELREVRASEPQDWHVRVIILRRPHVHVVDAKLILSKDDPDELKQAATVLKDRLATEGETKPILRAIKTGELLYHHQAVGRLVEANKQWFEGVELVSPKTIADTADYTNDEDHFVLDTDAGPVRVRSIAFKAELSYIDTVLPLLVSKEYVRVGEEKAISKFSAFEKYKIGAGKSLSLEMYQMPAEDGELVVIRAITSGGPS